jgi:hypothetical protein
MIRNVSLVNGQTDRLALPYSINCSNNAEIIRYSNKIIP